MGRYSYYTKSGSNRIKEIRKLLEDFDIHNINSVMKHIESLPSDIAVDNYVKKLIKDKLFED